MHNISELIGIIQGISFDGVVNQMETAHLELWIRKNRNLSYDPKQTKLIRLVDQVLEDHVITENEREELLFYCNQFAKEQINDAKVYELNGIIAGIICDNCVNEQEMCRLKDWMDRNGSEVRYCDETEEICKVIDDILEDGIVTPQEQDILLKMLSARINNTRLETKLQFLKQQVRERKNIGVELIDLLDNESVITEIHKRAEDQLRKTLTTYSGCYVSDSEIVFISLVLIAMMHYDGNYYEYVRATYQSLYQRFTEQKIEGLIRTILSKYRSKEDNKGNARIINIALSNSIVPSKFLPSFFEFIYDIYKLNLEYDITEKVYDDFKFIYEGIRSELLSDDDSIQLNITRKSYKLIKSTKQLILDPRNIDAVIKLSTIVVQLIDKKVWNKELHLYNPYLKAGFNGWVSTLKEEINLFKKHTKSEFRSRWEPKYRLYSNKICLVPPIHRVKAQYNYREICVVVKKGDKVLYTNYAPDIREIIGGYQVNNERIILEEPLGEISYQLMCGKDVIYNSKKSLFREFIVFDENGAEIFNNTDYNGTAVFCTKHVDVGKNIFYTEDAYTLASAIIRRGDVVLIDKNIFNFTSLVRPGVIGEVYFGHYLQVENTDAQIPVYKQLHYVVFECDSKCSRFDIVINGKISSLEDYDYNVTEREGIKKYTINIENLETGVYFLEVYSWINGKKNKIFAHSFAYDKKLNVEVEKINNGTYLIYVDSSLSMEPKLEEIEVSNFEEDWLQLDVNGKNYRYLIPYDMDIYRIDCGEWTPIENEIWIGDIHQESVIDIWGNKYNSMMLLTDVGSSIRDVPELKNRGIYQQAKVGFLGSYKASCDYVNILFLIDGIVRNGIPCFNKCLLDDEKTMINFNSTDNSLEIIPRFYGKGNIFLKITDDQEEEVYKSSFLKNNEIEYIDNLKSFVNYTITFYEKEKGISLRKERVLKVYQKRFYARKDFVGRSFKIKEVYYDQLVRNEFIRKKHYFNTTYLYICEMVDNDHYIGEIYSRTNKGAYMLDNINPVDVEICSDEINGIIELGITKEGDGLLLDRRHHSIKNTMDDDTAIDIFSYSMDICGEETF